MTSAIETLMNEHRVIEQVLGAMETYAGQLGRGRETDRRTLADFVEFLQVFADRCHHGKEEDRLFVAMVERGFPREGGPIAVMLADHTEGRRHVAALAGIAGGEGALTPTERQAVLEHALGYTGLLRSHIMKEDQVLYPIAVRLLPAEVMDSLATEFDVFEQNLTGPGEHQRLHSLADRLVELFPPDGSATVTPSCHHHSHSS
jgi:hemerythrin-like domain-containing protein